MVDVREMRVRVRRFGVIVRVDVAFGRLGPGMRVGVVTVVVPVAVFMRRRAMDMPVGVLPGEQDGQGDDEDERRQELHRPGPFAEKHHREPQTEEGSGGEEHLSPGRPERLRRRDVEDDADPIGKRTDQ